MEGGSLIVLDAQLCNRELSFPPNCIFSVNKVNCKADTLLVELVSCERAADILCAFQASLNGFLMIAATKLNAKLQLRYNLLRILCKNLVGVTSREVVKISSLISESIYLECLDKDSFLITVKCRKDDVLQQRLYCKALKELLRHNKLNEYDLLN